MSRLNTYYYIEAEVLANEYGAYRTTKYRLRSHPARIIFDHVIECFIPITGPIDADNACWFYYERDPISIAKQIKQKWPLGNHEPHQFSSGLELVSIKVKKHLAK